MQAKKNGKKTISGTFLRWLLIIVAIGFLVSLAFSWSLQTRLSRKSAVNLLNLNIQDVRQDVADASDENLLKLTREIAAEVGMVKGVNSYDLMRVMENYDVSEINLINERGIITATTYAAFLGYDMKGGEQSAEFLVLLDGETEEYVQDYRPISFDHRIYMKYAGVRLPDGFVEVAYNAARFHRDISERIIGVTRNRHVGEGGCIIIADENWNIVSDRHDNEGKNLEVTGIWIDRNTMPEGETFRADVYGQPCLCSYVFTEGYYIVAVMPQNEIVLQRDTSVLLTGTMEVLVFVALFLMIFVLLRKLVVNNINRVNHSLSKITGGDLEEAVAVRSHTEFAELSDDINATVDTLKNYIAEAAARIDQELAIAKSIQQSVLPSVFPPFPERTEFSLYAAMDTAKEVGGDFYDFYLLDDETLAFLIADVSGKGIPAAMFMMTGKTILRDYAERGDKPSDVFCNANDKLCEENDAEMFITAWMGFLDTKTGLVRFVNAGHNPPVLIRDGEAEFIRQKASLVLAGMEGVPYREQSVQLLPGDMIFLYTDGVPEGTDAHGQMFEGERLLRALSGVRGEGEAACRDACARVKAALDAFVGDAPQFDDITVLCLRYK